MGTARYSGEFKAEAVRLFKAGNKPVSRLAKEFGVADKTLRDWARQADADGEGGTPGVMTTPEKEELAALRKKCRELEMASSRVQSLSTFSSPMLLGECG